MAELAALLLGGCAAMPSPDAPPPPPALAEQRPPVTILVSIDGFRPAYLRRDVTPNLNLNRLAAVGLDGDDAPFRRAMTR